MAFVRELALKVSHTNGESTTLKFSPLNESVTATLKSRIKSINTGSIEVDGATRTVNYQPYLLSKNGSPAASITEATYTETETVRVYTRQTA